MTQSQNAFSSTTTIIETVVKFCTLNLYWILLYMQVVVIDITHDRNNSEREKEGG